MTSGSGEDEVVRQWVWDHLTDSPEESAELTRRSQLMHALTRETAKRGWSTEHTAKKLGVPIGVVEILLAGRIDELTVKGLEAMVETLGVEAIFDC